jgi:hypothetical protein
VQTAVVVAWWLRCPRVLCMDELEECVGEEPLVGNFTALGQEILRSRLERLEDSKCLAHEPTVVSAVVRYFELDC